MFRAIINADTAMKKGLKDGDVVWIESSVGNLNGEEVFGKVKGQVMTTQSLHPECVAIAGRFGARSPDAGYPARDGMCFNDLISFREEDADPITNQLDISPKVKIYKA